MADILHPILVVTTIATALIAGLFYSWACGIVQGLGKLKDKDYLQAMQSINREIQRPLFLVFFVGTVLLLPVTTWLSYRAEQQSTFSWLLMASILYIAGVFGVTIAGNVPLNNMLDRVKLTDSSPESITNLRAAFESKWNFLNRVRTICAVAALVCAVIAITKLI
ncbi:anthrone oxygenase family protein [Flavitalea sp.]|nr:anthrone oxygenase family protein [Flavitalea sp.]